MPPNMFAGAGPPPAGGGGGPMLAGPPMAGPQGPPQAPGNMISQPLPGGPQGAPQAPIVPPSPEKLKEVLTKQSMMVASLKQLLGEPDLKTKDILDSVGELVAEQAITPFMAAKSLSDLPPDGDSLKLRQWVGQHYANATQSFQTVSSMLAAHGAMMRRQQAGGAAMQPPPVQGPEPQIPAPPPSNQFSGDQ